MIAGPGRSGSTLVAELLGQLKAFESVGELNVLWNRGFLENQPCGCRTPFRDCAYWRSTAVGRSVTRWSDRRTMPTTDQPLSMPSR